MIRTLVATEARQHLRDPMTLALMVGVPVILYPLLGVAAVRLSARQEAHAESRAAVVAVVGELPLGDGFTRVPVEDAEAAVVEGKVQAAAVIGEKTEIIYDSRESASRDARARLAEAIEADAHERAPMRVTTVDALSPRELQRELAARMAPGLLVFTMLLGGIYTALDLVTGERERGTLETLLVTAVERRLVLLAKFLLVLTLTWSTAALSLLSAWAGAVVVSDLAVPLSSVLLALVLFLPLAVVLAAVLLLVAAWVPDFKTGQVATMPLLVFPALAAGASMAPSVSFTPFIAALPITNLSVALREVLVGRFDPLPLAICGLTSTIYAAATLAWAGNILGREDVVLGARGSGQRRLRGDFRLDAAAVVLLGLGLLWFVGQAAQTWDSFWGMALTQLGLILPLALAAPGWLGLPVRETLALRWPGLRNLGLAVIVGLSAPGVGLCAQWVQDRILPAPGGLFDDMIVLDRPLWALVPMFAVLPGLCEEILFRGAVMGLVRKNTGAVVSVVATAIAFGVFHLSLFRIFPTAMLGILMGVVAWRARSTAASVVAHVLNNSVGITLAVLAPEVDFGWWCVALAGIAVVAAGRITPRWQAGSS